MISYDEEARPAGSAEKYESATSPTPPLKRIDKVAPASLRPLGRSGRLAAPCATTAAAWWPFFLVRAGFRAVVGITPRVDSIALT